MGAYAKDVWVRWVGCLTFWLYPDTDVAESVTNPSGESILKFHHLKICNHGSNILELRNILK